MNRGNLRDGLTALRRRVIRVGLLSGVGRGLVAALVLLLLFAWADLVVELPPTVRLAASVIAVAGLIVLLAGAIARAMRLATSGALARRVDDVIDTGGQVLAGVDLSLAPQPAGAAPVTVGLSRIAVDRATSMMNAVAPVTAVSAQPAKRPLMLFGCMSAALLLGSLVSPRLFSTQFLRFADPFGDHPPYSRLAFEVAPGGTKVIYGKSFDVQVKTDGPAPDRVELVYRVGGGGGDEVLPMFPQTDGKWQATLAGITSGGEYFVRSGRARSHRYPVDVITVPKIEEVRFRITPPAYTNVGAYEGPLPKAGIAGLPGTTVEMWVKSNRPLTRGSAQLATSALPTTWPLERSPGAIALSPVPSQANQVAGAFTITAPGKVTLGVTDVAGQSSTDSFTAPITVLSDARPFVRVMEPKPESLATPDVTIDVILSAEDDYGVSRLQLFRTLNDSRASAAELPVPQPAATRVPGSAPLKLSDYGLGEGDVVKLYARVEDTDPAGPKGSESPIVTLRIISQEQMKQLMLQRDAMETLQSKYEQAARRMEALDQQLKKLQDELVKQRDKDKPIDAATQKKLEEIAEQAAKDAQAVREAAKEMQLPIDLDKALADELEKAAAQMGGLAKAAGEAGKDPNLSVAGADDKVAEMRKQLGAGRDELKKEATDPLEHLAKVFPLLEDQGRYLELYNRQRDLAERMASLKNQDAAVDDPKVRTRMRDLEDEQRTNREELRKLLDDIDDHVAALPPDKRLDDLRKTASDFAEAVRASEAAPEMNKSETALAEFFGSRASVSSKEAADILEKFISRCNGMGGEGQQCLKFQPALAAGMGNSVQQLLDSMGMGSGMGGMGAGGGYSARRTTMQNVGLYGNLPTRTEQARSGNGGKADRGAAADGRGKNANDDNASSGAEQADQTKTTGESAEAVPAQYRRSVGEYFQRVADELGEK